MKIKGAMTILKKRCEFFGWTFNELIEKLDNDFDDINSVIVAYEVYKMDQGYYWHGENFETWVKADPVEDAMDQAMGNKECY